VLIKLQGAHKSYGETKIFRDLSWQVHAGEHWALVGPNGAGKTTLLNIIANREELDRGQFAKAKNLSVSSVSQRDLAGMRQSTRDYLMGAFSEIIDLENELADLHGRIADGDTGRGILDKVSEIQERLLQAGGYTYETTLDRTFSGLGFSPDDADRPCGSFSGGEQMRLKLARALLQPSNLLLLDEPGNHLDANQRSWLGRFLREYPGAMIVVTHDSSILDEAIDHVACLMDGSLYTFRGDYASFEQQFEEMQKSRERAWKQQQSYIARTEAFIRRYKAGQRTKQARGREKILSRLERVEAPVREQMGFRLDLSFDAIPGEDVLAVENLLLALGERRLRVPKLQLKRGMRVALIGENGSGKTTLLKTLTGELSPLEGSVKWGSKVRIAQYDQHQRRFPFSGTLFDTIASLIRTPNKEQVMSCLGAFGFGGNRAMQNVGSLSGGERARLHLLAVLLDRANVLILDEPTNHIDGRAVEILKDALARFKGTLLLVSHDPAFLRELTSHTWGIAAGEVLSSPGWAPQLLSGTEPGRDGKKPERKEKPAASVGPQGLSKNQRFRLERSIAEYERELARLDSEKEEVEARFADPESVVSEDWHKLTTRLDEVKRALGEVEEKWLEATARLEEEDR